MEQDLIIKICERIASLETNVRILMALNGSAVLGVVGIAIGRIFKNGKNGNGTK